MAGIESRKENLKAFSLFIPSSSAVAIVVPLLDMPGIMAIPWAVPISMASKYVIFPVFSFVVFVGYRIKPQIMKAAAIGVAVLNVFSIGVPKIKPIKAVGIVPTVISGISRPVSVLKSRFFRAFRISRMSFLKKARTTMRVPMWSVTSKSIGAFKPRYCSVIFRCPVLDMGSHSVMPCIMPRIIVFRICSMRFSSRFYWFCFVKV